MSKLTNIMHRVLWKSPCKRVSGLDGLICDDTACLITEDFVHSVKPNVPIPSDEQIIQPKAFAELDKVKYTINDNLSQKISTEDQQLAKPLFSSHSQSTSQTYLNYTGSSFGLPLPSDEISLSKRVRTCEPLSPWYLTDGE
jgi:hypothetical protein